MSSGVCTHANEVWDGYIELIRLVGLSLQECDLPRCSSYGELNIRQT